MRCDDALLVDMLLAARKIQRFVAGVTWEQFSLDEMMQSAVIRELLVIGEAARMVTDERRASCAEIKWRAIAGMRNRLVHEYFAVDLEIVWNTVQVEIVPLAMQLEMYAPLDPGTIE